GLLVDLVRQPAAPPDVDLLHTAAALTDDAEELVEAWSDGALLEIWVEDDHQLVVTHAGTPPPLDSAATVDPWQEGDKRRARLDGPAQATPEGYRPASASPNPRPQRRHAPGPLGRWRWRWRWAVGGVAMSTGPWGRVGWRRS